MSYGSQSRQNTAASSTAALEQTEIPPELFLPFRGLSSVPLFFSDYCRKLTTHKGVTITRVIICTCEHFYLCHPNGDILRCFPFTAVSKILHDESRNQVGIVVPCEFDLAVETPLSFQLIRVIDVLRRMHGARTALQMIRVEPKPRPEGFLGLRPDGTTIWDPKFAKIHNRKNEQSCTDRALGFCGLEHAWISLKDTSYRYYRRAMRSLDLGIEDDDEVLTNTTAMSTAMMANNANANPMMMMTAGGKDGNNNNNGDPSSGGNNFTVMLAAGKTSFAFAKSFASRASFTGGNNINSNNKKDGKNNSNNGAEDDASLNFNAEEDELSAGYRWFRPRDEDLKKKKEEDEERKRKKKLQRQQAKSGRSFFEDESLKKTRFSDDPEDNEVLSMLLSPMLAKQNDDEDDGDQENIEDDDGDEDEDDEIVGRLSPRGGKSMFDEEGNFIENINGDDDDDSAAVDEATRRKKAEEKEKRKQKKLLKKQQREEAANRAKSPSADVADASRDQWWPGCQIGWTDGPYALTLAKPKGFKVALDQKNSEFL